MPDLAISRERDQKDRVETPSYYPTDDAKRRIAAIKRKVEEKDNYKRAYEKTWFVNGAFLRGQHY